MSTTDPIRDHKQLRKLTDYFLERKQYRNYVLIVLGTCTALRISDLLTLRWEDVYDFPKGKYRSHIELTEKKTRKRKRIPITPEIREALKLYFPYRQGNFIFSNGRKKEKPISRVQAWRIIHHAANEVGIDGNIACHSLRKTFGYFAWKFQKTPSALLMEIYNHSAETITKHYLGITQDDIDRVYKNNNFRFSSFISGSNRQKRHLSAET